ncbi:hypothetical protein B0H13DRAFT_2676686 [Mycena leptocephala]|nr:hypothetical protein B0H13DRAFT_2676686 [Mycena leptocephala]
MATATSTRRRPAVTGARTVALFEVLASVRGLQAPQQEKQLRREIRRWGLDLDTADWASLAWNAGRNTHGTQFVMIIAVSEHHLLPPTPTRFPSTHFVFGEVVEAMNAVRNIEGSAKKS